LRGRARHNIRNLDCDIPLDMLVCVTGVSGSGKSTLMHHVLSKALAHELGADEGAARPGSYKQLTGAQYLNEVGAGGPVAHR
jgi:excinuclease ABC subunit A